MNTHFLTWVLLLSFATQASPSKAPNVSNNNDPVLKNEFAGSPVNPGVGMSDQGSRSPDSQINARLAPSGLSRAPGPSIIEIRYHRDEKSGKFIIDEVDPEGPFKHLKEVKETDAMPTPHFTE